MMIRLNLGVNTGKIDNNVRFSILCYKQYSEACLNRTSLWPTIVFEIDKYIDYREFRFIQGLISTAGIFQSTGLSYCRFDQQWNILVFKFKWDIVNIKSRKQIQVRYCQHQVKETIWLKSVKYKAWNNIVLTRAQSLIAYHAYRTKTTIIS